LKQNKRKQLAIDNHTYFNSKLPTITKPKTKSQPENTQIQMSTKNKHKKAKTDQTINTLTNTLETAFNKTISSSADVSQTIQSTNLFPKHIPIKDDIGKFGLMWPRALAKFHEASNLLNWYSDQGCPVNCGPPWSHEHILAALQRGPHKSAQSPEAKLYLKNETFNKVKEGFAKVIQWKMIKHNIPTNFKLSPVATVPHKSRDFRVILDLSFQLKINNKPMPSVNNQTHKLAPQKSMAKLGECLRRIIQTMGDNYDKNHPFKFAKCDIKDGFWRLVVSETDAWNFCYALPLPSSTTHIDDTEIVIPTSLQMGWCESPPFFCAATETARDVIQALFTHLGNIPPHPHEHYMVQNTPPSKSLTNTKNTKLIEVYVDDFITATNNLDISHLTQMARATLHGIHSIFPPTAVSKHSGGDPISEKKMIANEGLFDYEKEILGWIFNGVEYTISLPTAKVKKIQTLLKQTAKQGTVPIKQFQQLTGKLNHAAIGIPAGRGLFSPIYNALAKSSSTIKITPQLRQALRDWSSLLRLIGSRPTNVLELIPQTPDYISYVDASGFGVGGVWLHGTTAIPHTVWRRQWPADITNRLVSTSNPTGDITNSDLEMAGVLLTWLVLEQIAQQSLKFSHVGIFCDNTPSVAWANRLTSSKSIIAGHLLRALALRQHLHQTSPLLTISIAGEANTMADVASRSFRDQRFTSTNTSFCTKFNQIFPLQSNCWREFHLSDKLFSRVTSCLRGKQLTMESWTKLPGDGKNIGLTGAPIQPRSITNRTSDRPPTCNAASSSQPSLLGSGLVTTAKRNALRFKPLQTRFLPSPRPLSWLENSPQSTKHKELTSSQWHGLSKASAAKTHHQLLNSQSQSPSPKLAMTSGTSKGQTGKKQKETSP
jgi:hypothetical protein